MYTQCDHCKAIFEVSMREVTVAAGKLRCGECNAVFDAMASLSTTMPEPFSAVSNKRTDDKSPDAKSPETETNAPAQKDQTSRHQKEIHRPEIEKPDLKEKVKDASEHLDSKWLNIIAMSLAILLFSQVLYNNRQYLTNAPMHAPEHIEMLNNNVFAHPNEEGILLISASIENHADHAQPYPILEVSLTNADSRLVALRRFKPSEYLENYNEKMLLETNKPTNLKLKIADPGSDATRFKFKFL